MRLVLVDDQADFRSSLRDLLSSVDGVEIVGEAADGRSGAAIALSLRPDIVLMDIRMPIVDGITATADICTSWPGACVLALTTFDEDVFVKDAMAAGASGYLLKGMPLEDMLSVFHLALRGYTTIAPRAGVAQLASPTERFSERMEQIWRMLGEGCTNREIAGRLFITEGTVKNYVSGLLAALGVRHRTEAALLWKNERTSMSKGTRLG